MSSLIVFIHGSGGTGSEMSSFLSSTPVIDGKTFPTLMREIQADIIYPTASLLPYLPLNGAPSSVWFNRSRDFNSLGRQDKYEDVHNIRRSAERIIQCIRQTEVNTSRIYENIFIGGFSMGGALSLHILGLLNELECNLIARVKGIFVASSFLIESSRFFKAPVLNHIPLIMLHSQSDDLIDFEWGSSTVLDILRLGYTVEFKTYSFAGHELIPDMVRDIAHWIDNRIKIIGSATENDYQSNGSENIAINHAYIEEINQVPYRISHETDQNIYRIDFNVPFESRIHNLLCARPILACGSAFEILSDGQGVYTIVSSVDPNSTAKEISSRLYRRLEDGGAVGNPCPMS